MTPFDLEVLTCVSRLDETVRTIVSPLPSDEAKVTSLLRYLTQFPLSLCVVVRHLIPALRHNEALRRRMRGVMKAYVASGGAPKHLLLLEDAPPAPEEDGRPLEDRIATLERFRFSRWCLRYTEALIWFHLPSEQIRRENGILELHALIRNGDGMQALLGRAQCDALLLVYFKHHVLPMWDAIKFRAAPQRLRDFAYILLYLSKFHPLFRKETASTNGVLFLQAAFTLRVVGRESHDDETIYRALMARIGTNEAYQFLHDVILARVLVMSVGGGERDGELLTMDAGVEALVCIHCMVFLHPCAAIADDTKVALLRRVLHSNVDRDVTNERVLTFLRDVRLISYTVDANCCLTVCLSEASLDGTFKVGFDFSALPCRIRTEMVRFLRKQKRAVAKMTKANAACPCGDAGGEGGGNEVDAASRISPRAPGDDEREGEGTGDARPGKARDGPNDEGKARRRVRDESRIARAEVAAETWRERLARKQGGRRRRGRATKKGGPRTEEERLASIARAREHASHLERAERERQDELAKRLEMVKLGECIAKGW